MCKKTEKKSHQKNKMLISKPILNLINAEDEQLYDSFCFKMNKVCLY